MLKASRQFSQLLLNSKAKLMTPGQELAILLQIQLRDLSLLPVLIESYTYSILQSMHLKDVPDGDMASCLQFVQAEIRRLALLEIDQPAGETFTRHVPWWINGAVDAFKEMQQEPEPGYKHPAPIPENLFM